LEGEGSGIALSVSPINTTIVSLIAISSFQQVAEKRWLLDETYRHKKARNVAGLLGLIDLLRDMTERFEETKLLQTV